MINNFPDTQRIGKRVIYLPKCHSTNDIAAGLIKNERVTEGTIIISDHQTAGRGQRGNTWESEPGMNLTFSLILTPGFLKAEKNFFLNIVIALGVFDALNPSLPGELSVKWPNDIYYSHQKLGGILIENSIQSKSIESSIAGIGLNVMQEHFLSEKATSLRNILGRDIDKIEIFSKIIGRIDERYGQLYNRYYKKLKDDYMAVLYRYNELHYYKTSSVFPGRITGIDQYGRLKVESAGKTNSYDLKEIEFLED